MSTKRLFLGLPLPLPVRQALSVLQTDAPGIRWARPDQFHVTLRFLGDTPEDRMADLITGLEPVRVEPFILLIGGVGVFPPKGPPKMLWAGVGSGHPRLFQLRQKLDDTLIRCRVDADIRDFHPHVTLGRCGEGAQSEVAAWLKSNRNFETAPVRVDALWLWSSRLTHDGPEHTVEHKFEFDPRRP